ncbi:MAG: glycosyltransferase family 39 protein [Phormidesmis sp. CAN_BIN44]|nr:glycosyltransferase family 39 protein [Phormidesmis sp. CAN_BIN44]
MNVKVFRSYKLYLLLAIAIGVFIRFSQLTLQSLWGDELYSVRASSSESLNQMFSTWIFPDTHPPGYQTLLYFWVKTFGNSDLSARSLSAVAGAAALFAMYYLTKDLFGKHLATSATTLAALTYPGLAYSQEVRSYSLLFLCSTVSTLLWLKVLPKREISSGLKIQHYCAFVLSIICTSYIHYFGLFLTLFQLAYLLFLSFFLGRNRLASLAVSACLGITYVPWIIAVIFNNPNVKSSASRINWVNPPSIFSPISYLNFLLFSNFLLSAVAVFFLLVLPVALKFKKSPGKLFQKMDFIKDPSSPVFALLYLFSSIYLVIFLISQRTPILVHRNLLIIAPAAYLLIALCLNNWLKDYRQNAYVLLVCSLGLVLILPKYYAPTKDQWREAVQYTVQRSDSNSIVKSLSFEDNFNYYFNSMGSKVSATQLENNLSSAQKLYLEMKTRTQKKLFLLVPPNTNLDEQSNRFLEDHSTESKQQKFVGLVVYEFSLE